MNSAALADPSLITRLAQRYGSQAVVVAVDAKAEGSEWTVFARSGQISTSRDAVEWAREAESRGAGEILLTSIDRDGTKSGFDCQLTSAVAAAVSIPVIASGGAGRVRTLSRCSRMARPMRLAAGVPFLGTPVKDEEVFTRARDSGATMLIPSIDLQGGRIVQLVQGEKLAVETTDIQSWISRFHGMPKVQLIDLDAAKDAGDNDDLVTHICAELPCRVGGGIRTVGRAQDVLEGRHPGDPRLVALQPGTRGHRVRPDPRGSLRTGAADRRRG